MRKNKSNQYNKKILVLGGSGFLGSKFVEMAPKDKIIYSTYLSHPLGWENIEEFQLDLLNLEEAEKLIREIHPDIIFHTAKSRAFDENPELNKASMEKIVALSKELNIGLIFLSTDSVFDGQKGDYKETDVTNPPNAYGLGKVAAEEIIKSNLDNFVIIRTSYIYGRTKNGLDKRSFEIQECAQKSQDLSRFTDLFRSVTLVDDLAEASWQLVDNDFCGIIHVAGEKMSIFDFTKGLAKALGFNDSFAKPGSIYNQNRPFPPDTSLNTDLAKTVLDFKPTSIEKDL